MVKVTMMGEDGIETLHYDELPGAEQAPALEDYFKPVEISPKAIDTASRIVPQKYYVSEGLHTFLKKRADFVFSKMTAQQTRCRFKGLMLLFEFNENGPVLKNVELAPEV